jgi:acyl-CoA thioesterase II
VGGPIIGQDGGVSLVPPPDSEDPRPPLEVLLHLLDLEPIEVDIFRGASPDTRRQRVFGGQVAGQALVAAGRTVDPARSVHSLHAYFLRPGDTSIPIVFTVERVRDGRSFTTRRVMAVQHGKPIFALTASFCVPEDGWEHSDPPPQVPRPDELTPLAERIAPLAAEHGELGKMWLDWVRGRPFDLRYVGDPPVVAAAAGEPHPARSAVWMRATGELPDEPLVHVCALVYASDMTLLDSTLLPHGVSWESGNVAGASLDHAMWFHRPFRADEWLLYDQASPSAGGGRGLATGRIFAEDGRLVASVVQEGLIRPTRRR